MVACELEVGARSSRCSAKGSSTLPMASGEAESFDGGEAAVGLEAEVGADWCWTAMRSVSVRLPGARALIAFDGSAPSFRAVPCRMRWVMIPVIRDGADRSSEWQSPTHGSGGEVATA